MQRNNVRLVPIADIGLLSGPQLFTHFYPIGLFEHGVGPEILTDDIVIAEAARRPGGLALRATATAITISTVHVPQ